MVFAKNANHHALSVRKLLILALNATVLMTRNL